MIKNKNNTELQKKTEEILRFCLSWLGRIHMFLGRNFVRFFVLIGNYLGKIPLGCRLSVISAVGAALLLAFSWFGLRPYVIYAGFTPEQLQALTEAGAFKAVDFFRYFTWIFSGILVVCTGVAYWRNRISYQILRLGASAFLLALIFLLLLAFNIPGTLLSLNREDYDGAMRNMLWFDTIWMWLPFFVLSVFFVLMMMRSKTKEYYAQPVLSYEVGDRIIRGLTCKGEHPVMVRSSYWAFAYHFFILLVIPLLGRGCYSMDSYEIPQGDGAVQVIIQTRPKPKKKPKPKYVFNPNSPILFLRPELDDTRMEELEKLTTNEYQATPMGPPTNKKNARPGWPNGIENAKLRFIRLKYSGGDWDQDMGKGADYNMLLWINKNAGFRIADDTEAISVQELSHWRKNKKPPFVYITGRGNINMTAPDIKILKKYLLEEGGMLFADNGGGNFNASIRALLRRILPDMDLIDIANDDIIYQTPFQFPDGAPPLWHHSGTRALGIKHNGRWIVYYHQGDINDAWKAGGSGVTADIQERAFKLGANVIAYSFTQYLAQIYGDELMSSGGGKD